MTASGAVGSEELIAALRHPTVDGFNRWGRRAEPAAQCAGRSDRQPQLGTDKVMAAADRRLLLCCPPRRALELLQGAAQQRFAAVQDGAAEQAEAVGEADLRRLKRQFSSLKNTFLHYEVKNEFLAGAPRRAGSSSFEPATSTPAHHFSRPPPCRAPPAAELLDGRPHGDEGELLQHFEAEVEASVAQLRQLKQANEEAQAGIAELVVRVAAAHDAFERQQAAVGGELARLQQEVAQHQQSVGAGWVALPELPEGPGEEECQVAMAAAAGQERELEAAIAAGVAEAEGLAAAIASEREEAEALRAQLGDLESQNAQQVGGGGAGGG